jgi:hypothetical protein
MGIALSIVGAVLVFLAAYGSCRESMCCRAVSCQGKFVRRCTAGATAPNFKNVQTQAHLPPDETPFGSILDGSIRGVAGCAMLRATRWISIRRVQIVLRGLAVQRFGLQSK